MNVDLFEDPNEKKEVIPDYQFNDHGICLNPTEIQFVPPTKNNCNYGISLFFAYRNGYWFAGHKISEPLQGSSSPCRGPKYYKTKNEAIIAGRNYLKDKIKNCTSQLQKEFSENQDKFLKFLSP